MRNKKIFKKNDSIITTYRYPINSYNIKLAINRIGKIMKQSKSRNIIPEIFYEFIDHEFRCEQVYVKKEKNKNLNIDNLFNFSQELDAIHSEGLIHGDIKFSNIIQNNNSFKIIDWEPVLEYKSLGTKYFQSTSTYISKEDINLGVITKKTDLNGFYAFIHRLKFGSSNFKSLSLSEIEDKVSGKNAVQIFSLFY